ncbi:PLP-dependent cysteine synthase family protein [Bdellovibrionota bacterium FG-1]
MQTREWVSQAIRKIEADFNRSADTHLFKLDLPVLRGVDIYLKDESTHPTGSLKHRLARSLFLYSLCNGWIHEDTTVIEASSGSTAVSEAYFARILGLPFIAVMPRTTSPEKIAQISFYGGRSHLVDDPSQVYSESLRLTTETRGHFMDQFTYAERATDWRGNNNIAEAVFEQMSKEAHPIPTWMVCGAGTGGTSATLGRFSRYQCFDTQVCVVDPENSVFYDYYHTRNCNLTLKCGSRIEGIGRPRVEASFIPQVIDRMIRVPDAASFASMRFLEQLIGKKAGGSTGTNLWGSFLLASEMITQNQIGSIVTLLCDSGERYSQTYYSNEWLAENHFDIAPYLTALDEFRKSGKLGLPGRSIPS